MSFGKWLKAAREAKDIAQAEVARRWGVSPVTVHKWENDLTRPSTHRIPAIAETLDLDVGEMVDRIRVQKGAA